MNRTAEKTTVFSQDFFIPRKLFRCTNHCLHSFLSRFTKNATRKSVGFHRKNRTLGLPFFDVTVYALSKRMQEKTRYEQTATD